MKALTATEMKERFLISYDFITNYEAPGLTDSEISYLLSKAQSILVKHYYNPNGNKYIKGFEQNEKRRKDLAQLTKTQVITTFTNTDDNVTDGYSVELGTEPLWIASESLHATITKGDCVNTVEFDVVPTTHDSFLNERKNPFRKSGKDKILRLDIGDENETLKVIQELIIPSNITPIKYQVRYIKKPTEINIEQGISSTLNAQMHDEIIEEAVQLALENTQRTTRFQSHRVINNNKE